MNKKRKQKQSKYEIKERSESQTGLWDSLNVVE